MVALESKARAITALSLYYLKTMSKENDRLANRAGLVTKKCSCGTVYTDPVTGKSVYDGNRSRKSPRHERRIADFLRSRERLGMD
ncbi:MAG: hypothetical protein ACKO0M_02225 [Cyanobium sp.]